MTIFSGLAVVPATPGVKETVWERIAGGRAPAPPRRGRLSKTLVAAGAAAGLAALAAGLVLAFARGEPITDPRYVWSPSHDAGKPSENLTVEMAWSAQPDAAGYSLLWTPDRSCYGGYRAIVARDGIEALEVVERHLGSIDLLVTDVVMPKLGGRELAERLTTRVPGLPVLYLSGYTDDAVMFRGVGEEAACFLAKPFTSDALVAKVREALAARPRPGSGNG